MLSVGPNNASYKYYDVLTFHGLGLVLIFARTLVVVHKKIYGHLIRMYFGPSVLFLKLNMKTWNGQPTTLIEFRFTVYLSIYLVNFTPCCATELLFVLCNSTLSVDIVSAHSYNCLAAQHFIVSFQYFRWPPRKWLTILLAKQCW